MVDSTDCGGLTDCLVGSWMVLELYLVIPGEDSPDMALLRYHGSVRRDWDMRGGAKRCGNPWGDQDTLITFCLCRYLYR